MRIKLGGVDLKGKRLDGKEREWERKSNGGEMERKRKRGEKEGRAQLIQMRRKRRGRLRKETARRKAQICLLGKEALYKLP